MNTCTKHLLTALTASALLAGSANAAPVVLLDPLVGDGDFDSGLGSWVSLPSAISGNPISRVYGGLNGRPAGASDQAYSTDYRREFGRDLGYTIAAGDTFDLSYYFTAHSNNRWDLAEDTGDVVLYYTADNTIGGTVSDAITLNSGLVSTLQQFQFASTTSQAFSSDAGAGKKLFIKVEAESTASDEHFVVDVISVSVTPVPEPGSLALLGLGGLCVLRRRRN